MLKSFCKSYTDPKSTIQRLSIYFMIFCASLSCVFFYGGYAFDNRVPTLNCTIYNYTKQETGPIVVYRLFISNKVKNEMLDFVASNVKEINYYNDLIEQKSFNCYYKSKNLVFKSAPHHLAQHIARRNFYISLSVFLIFTVIYICIEMYMRHKTRKNVQNPLVNFQGIPYAQYPASNYGSNVQNPQQSLLPSPPKIATVLKVQKHMMDAYKTKDCMICTDEMKEGEDIEAFIPCQHGIHAVCRNGIEKCPVCGNV